MPHEEQKRRSAARESAPGRASGGREARPAPKRPRRRRSAFGTLIYILFIIGASALLASLGWVWANDVLALNKPEQTYVITITEDEPFSQVVSDLKKNGIIEHKMLFTLFSLVTGGTSDVVPGAYTLTTDMDYRAILTNMGAKSSSRKKISVTITEGLTTSQIFSLLEAKGVSSVEYLNRQASEHDYKFSFLADIPLGDPNRLEGYLFPDTYEFYLGHDPLYAINKMLVQFDAKFTDEMRRKASESGMTIHQIVTMASMIEKETDGTDQANIASVIYNRLNGNATGGKLQIDATVQYILPERKENLTTSDLAIDSPYNTYLYKGLPPGPIGNPGISAIYAAMNPTKTNYLYYALGDDNIHHFFSSYDAHLQFIATQNRYKNG